MMEFKGRTSLKIKTIVDSAIGWIKDSLVGKSLVNLNANLFFKIQNILKIVW
jgi:hypothetical protein